MVYNVSVGEDMNNFEIINETSENLDEIDTMKGILEFALNYLNINNSIFNVIIVSLNKIHELNKTYRNIDRPTDVISFALEDDETFIKTDYRVLGDIYICLDKAREQAIEYGHSFKREICFLSIHGLLHLLGYDHMNPEDEKVMFDLQDKILNEYGITRE